MCHPICNWLYDSLATRSYDLHLQCGRKFNDNWWINFSAQHLCYTGCHSQLQQLGKLWITQTPGYAAYHGPHLQWTFRMLEAKLEAKAGRSLFTETWQNKPASFSFELYVQREKRPGDCELFEIGSARTRSDADAAHESSECPRPQGVAPPRNWSEKEMGEVEDVGRAVTVPLGVRRNKCWSMKMRVLENKWKSSSHLNLTVLQCVAVCCSVLQLISPQSDSLCTATKWSTRSNNTWHRLCGTLWPTRWCG